MDLTFENKQSGNGGLILMKNEAEEIGRLTYTIVPDINLFVISYVMVFSKFEGLGLGKKLIDEALEFARKNQWNLKAHCSFAHSVLVRRTDVGDVFIA